MVYFFSGPVISFVANKISDDFFDSYIKETEDYYKGFHCVSVPQEEIIHQLFLRLGEHPKDYKIFVSPSLEPNAFAYLGNLIIINQGLLKKAKSPDVLIAIIAHEVAHIKKQHVKRKYVKRILFDALWDSLFSSSSSKVFKQVAGDVFSQAEEREADQFASELLIQKKISHDGISLFFKELEKEEHFLFKYLVFSHPSYPERIKMFQGKHLSQEVISEESFHLLKQGCLTKKD